MSTISFPLVCAAAKFSHHSCPELKVPNTQIRHSQKAAFHWSVKKDSSVAVACSVKDSDPKEEGVAMETVLKLHKAIKNKNINELSDIIADGCTCYSNIVPAALQPFHGKKQVLAFFVLLMKKLGDNIEFVVQPTSGDGMAVGVSWKLEWSNAHLSLGKGFSLYTCHNYKGNVMIKNVEIFMEPLLRTEPIRLKLFSLLMTALEKLNPGVLFKKDNAKSARVVVLFMLFLAGILLVFKFRAPA